MYIVVDVFMGDSRGTQPRDKKILYFIVNKNKINF